MGRTTTKTPEGEAQKLAAFYARGFSPQESEALESLAAQGLEGEIQMLRVVIRRVMHLASGAESLEEAEKALSSLSLATTRLARLLGAQESLGGDNQCTRMLIQAIAEVAQELGLTRKEGAGDSKPSDPHHDPHSGPLPAREREKRGGKRESVDAQLGDPEPGDPLPSDPHPRPLPGKEREKRGGTDESD